MNLFPTSYATVIPGHTPMAMEIYLLIADRAIARAVADLMAQSGYRITQWAPQDVAECLPSGSLLIADEISAQRHQTVLLGLKQKLQPLYFPMLLALTGTSPAAPWLRAGFDDVLRLPLNKEDLLLRIEVFLRLRRHSEQMVEASMGLRATVDLAPVGIANVSADGALLFCNARFCQLTGLPGDDLRDTDNPPTLYDILHPDHVSETQMTIAALFAGKQESGHKAEKRFCQPGGEAILATASFSLVRDIRQNPHHITVVVEEIPVQQKAQGLLHASEGVISSAIDALTGHVCVIDEAGRILAVNKAWHDFGVDNGIAPRTVWEHANYLTTTELAAASGVTDATAFLAGLREVAGGNRTEFSMEYACHSQAGQRWFTARVARFRGDGVARLIISHEDVARSRLTQEALFALSRTDSQTGLPNRAMLQEQLATAMVQASRQSQAVWTVFLGLDRFELAVQTLGHAAGDQIICTIASRLKSSIRSSDIVARFGGDQFALILGEVADDTQSLNLLTRILQSVAQPIPLEGQEFFLSCSMGIAIYPHDGDDADTLLDHANTAMYRAKAQGRNNFHFYTPAMDDAVKGRLRLEQALRRAVEREEFVLHYQPQVDLCTGAIVGVEALIRWLHPEHGLMAPDTFIGAAEETGLILPIGDWVIRTACRQASAWQHAGLGRIRMAVNLSARQFIQKDLAEKIAAALQETGLDPRLLDVELTESVVMENLDETIATLHQLKKLGVQLSIDDFGTGYSSLSNLKRFPIDVLKIDRSFVSDITITHDDGAIPNAIIAMAHSLGISVIAEGVETEFQCEFLSRNMCDEIQGYWFSRPLAPDGVEAVLREAKCLPKHLLRLQKAQRVLLLVDDEQNVISALRRMLRGDGYRILIANSGQEGLDVLEKNKVDVILSDQRMPGMTGVEFLRNVKMLHPDTVRIVLSGFTELQSVTDAVNEGAIYKFLTKPWDDAQLRGHIGEAFKHKEMADENRRLALEVRAANHGLAQANRQLGDMLQQQLQQISRDEITIEIVREALQHVPVPIIGLDDDGLVAFANLAAQTLHGRRGAVLGTYAETSMPEILQATRSTAEGEKSVVCIAGEWFELAYRSMGNGTASRGILITMTPLMLLAALQRDLACDVGGQPVHV